MSKVQHQTILGMQALDTLESPGTTGGTHKQAYPLINDVIIVIIRVTGIPVAVLITVFLPRVWHDGTVILQPIRFHLKDPPPNRDTAKIF